MFPLCDGIKLFVRYVIPVIPVCFSNILIIFDDYQDIINNHAKLSEKCNYAQTPLCDVRMFNISLNCSVMSLCLT